VFLANGGEFSPFYRDLDLVIYWQAEGAAIKAEEASIYKSWSRTVKNVSYYFRSGISFPKRTDFLNAHLLPSDCIFTVEGLGFFPDTEQDAWTALALLNSRLFSYLINSYCGQHKHVGYIKQLPLMDDGLGEVANLLSYEGFVLKRYWATTITGSTLFILPAVLSTGYLQDQLSRHQPVSTNDVGQINDGKTLLKRYEHVMKLIQGYAHLLNEIQQKLDTVVFDKFGISESTQQLIIGETARRDFLSPLQGIYSPAETESSFWIRDLLAYCIGCIYGVWDLRLATGEAARPVLPNPFASLPTCAPGALTVEGGLPVTEAPAGYPIRIIFNSALVDDPDHADDLVVRVREVFEVIWPNTSHARERETCELLGVSELRDYFRKSSAGGFWLDHVNRYTKGRRKAPIYWLLRSAKGNYAVWLYYHWLEKDTLFKVLLNYVEPKVQLEQNNLAELSHLRETTGPTGHEAKQLARQIERQESLLSELYDFRDKLKRAADLNLEPDLNDGVVLNIAPLWELVPWKEAEKYWKELIAGKYEWSSISKQLRERGLVKK
jgi:hypothetical protein